MAVPIRDATPLTSHDVVHHVPGRNRAVGVTERELTRLFNQHLRTPPAQYWRQIRLKAAHWMVLNGNRSITRIAHECGFTDSSYLIHWFRRAYHSTPTRLRSVHRQLGVH